MVQCINAYICVTGPQRVGRYEAERDRNADDCETLATTAVISATLSAMKPLGINRSCIHDKGKQQTQARFKRACVTNKNINTTRASIPNPASSPSAQRSEHSACSRELVGSSPIRVELFSISEKSGCFKKNSSTIKNARTWLVIRV